MGPLKTGEELVTDHLQMANMLNDFFCSVFTEENLEDIPQMAQQYKGDDPLLVVKFTKENVKEFSFYVCHGLYVMPYKQ